MKRRSTPAPRPLASGSLGAPDKGGKPLPGEDARDPNGAKCGAVPLRDGVVLALFTVEDRGDDVSLKGIQLREEPDPGLPGE